MTRLRLSPAGRAKHPDLAARVATGTEEAEPVATQGVVKVLWSDGTAGWFRAEELETVT